MKRYALPTITAACDFVSYVTDNDGNAAIVKDSEGNATKYVVSDMLAPEYGAVELGDCDEC